MRKHSNIPFSFIFPTIDKYVREDDTVVTSIAKSKDYVNIPQLMMTHGPGLISALRMRLPILPRMIGCVRESRRSASSIVENPRIGKIHISPDEFRQLEELIYSYGIGMIGYTDVPRDLIFRDHKILYGKAIVLAMEMSPERMDTAPSKTALKEVFRSYYGLGKAVNLIADFMRQNGFNAMPAPAVGGDVSYVPLAERAGLGAIGRHGLLITSQFYGPSLRLAAIYTDIENLPYSDPADNEHLWIHDFCATCGKCIVSCPGNAIYPEPNAANRCINQTKCAIPFARQYGCSLCIKNCTFFNSNAYQKLKSKYTAT